MRAYNNYMSKLDHVLFTYTSGLMKLVNSDKRRNVMKRPLTKETMEREKGNINHIFIYMVNNNNNSIYL